MKKLLLFLLALVVFAVVGVSVYVSTIDWNQHKNVIAQQFSEATGKRIVFEGPVSFKFLPTPYLNASNVKILNPSGGAKTLVEIPDLIVRLSLMPLLKGQFDVQRMELRNPQINVEVLEGGKLNWQSDLTPEQRQNIEDAKIALNSVSVGNATLNFEDPLRDVFVKLENLNGEIIAQHIMGPYKIEGNYIKDNSPEGFAISVGQLSDSFATSLNFVVTHPVSESYIRFDGSFMLANKVLNGNVIIESKKLKQFVQANFKELNVDDVYDFPLALTSDINLNDRQLNLSNIVVKYGETQGAGNLQMPFNDGFGNGGVKPRIDAAFNFTDLDLSPAIYALFSFVREYASPDVVYNPQVGVDVLADIKSVRTTYKGQQIKDFEISFDWMENILTLNKLSAILPGDTDVKVEGTISAFDDKPFYNLETSLSSNDFLRTLNWLDVAPEVPVAATYRKAAGSAKFAGNLQRVQISPFQFTLDKSSVSGEAGIKLDTPRKDIMLVVNTDMVNFDNYIVALPDEVKAKDWAQRMIYRFSKLGFLNDFDMQAKLKMNLAIYESMPFENVSFVGNLLDGKLAVENLQIGSVANSAIEARGLVSGFGQSPLFEDFNYSIQTNDLAALVNKMELKVPSLDYKKLNDFQIWGAVNGNMSEFSTETNVNLEDLNLVYRGQVGREGAKVFYNGELELKHPDFVKMLNDLEWNYNPKAYSLGLFDLKAKINGYTDALQAEPLNFNIGFNTFGGKLRYERGGGDGRPSVTAEMNVNKFEIERFLNQDAEKGEKPIVSPEGATKAEFISQPVWTGNAIDYDFYKTFDLNGHFNVQELSYKSHVFKQAQFAVSLLQGNADVKNFSADYLGGKIDASLQLQMREKPALKGQVKISEADVNQMSVGGNLYALSNGKFSAEFSCDAPAENEKAFVSGMNADVVFDFSNVSFKGWNLKAIYEDLLKRERVEGLNVVVKEALTSGRSDLASLKGRATVKGGSFVLADTVARGENFDISVSGDGNLSEWLMNVLFNVQYDEPRYLPGFAFSFKGPISAPLLDVDVGALFNFYQIKQDQEKADIKAAEDAEKERLTLLMQEQKRDSEALIADIRNNFERDLENKKQDAFSEEANEAYAAIKQKLGNIVTILAQNSSRAENPNVDEDVLREIHETNVQSVMEIEEQRNLFNSAYVEDLKKHNQAIYRQIIEGYNRSKALSFNYNAIKEGFEARLAAIDTEFELKDDVNISGWQEFIEDKIEAIERQDKKLLDDVKNMQTATDVEVAEKYKKQLQDLKNLLEVDLKDIEESFAEYKEYAEKKVSAQENAYAAELREKEVQRKLEENTGSISIKKSGKTLTVRRDIEEIEKAEEMAEDKEIRVLDFSRPKAEVKTQAPSGNVNVVKKGRVKLN